MNEYSYDSYKSYYATINNTFVPNRYIFIVEKIELIDFLTSFCMRFSVRDHHIYELEDVIRFGEALRSFFKLIFTTKTLKL